MAKETVSGLGQRAFAVSPHVPDGGRRRGRFRLGDYAYRVAFAWLVLSVGGSAVTIFVAPAAAR